MERRANDSSRRKSRAAIRAVAVLAMISLLLLLVSCGKSAGAGSTSSTSTPLASDPADIGPPPLPAAGPAQGTLRITAGPGNSLTFAPDNLNARTGLYRVTIEVASAGHAFAFLSPSTRFASLTLDRAGAEVSGRVLFPKAGNYEFACLVPGHKGMAGIVHVTGPDRTLDQALSDAAHTTPSNTVQRAP
jgi:plastocyanin